MTTEGTKPGYEASTFRNIRVTGSSRTTQKADLVYKAFGLSKREIQTAVLCFIKIGDRYSTTTSTSG